MVSPGLKTQRKMKLGRFWLSWVGLGSHTFHFEVSVSPGGTTIQVGGILRLSYPFDPKQILLGPLVPDEVFVASKFSKHL